MLFLNHYIWCSHCVWGFVPCPSFMMLFLIYNDLAEEFGLRQVYSYCRIAVFALCFPHSAMG